MRSAGLFMLLTVAALTLAPAADSERGNPAEVLDAPGGRPVAILLSGAQPRVLEQREGYVRIALEGWVRASGAAETAPTAPAGGHVVPDSTQTVGTGAIAGSIVVTLSGGEVRKGAGARLALLGKVAELEAARRELAAAYQPEAHRIQEEIASVEARRRAALNSTDNLGQATQSLDRAKRDLAARQKELAALQATYEGREGVLVERYAQQEVHAGEDGSFRFAGVAPGEYRLWAIYTVNEATDYRWYLPVRVAPGTDAAMDLASRKPNEDPFLTIP
ncbi:MAG TPA: hypothetical protein VFW45_08155 [Candidatus Polarisedimenticolia bacterium]|nr:hypothetical protein [Candidatus Polarisedimenticolia bacterium]